ncbi:MAG: aromatic amino acid aminotransferase [Phycisphaeraceae bacterium]|nr:aromatic amino acid aminotransferase [Phycisphaeraceae bacterium]
MFEKLEMAPPDPILGLTEAFRGDSNPKKINLGVGVYKDAAGNTPVLECVKQAEKALLASETTKNYLAPSGAAEYAAIVQPLVFGASHEIVTGGRAVTAHTPGGTGALRLAGDYLKKMHPEVTLWMSDPTWPNHPGVFASAGVPTKTYSYFDADTNALRFDDVIAALEKVPAGDVVLLHGCCHNPTGMDPTVEQWRRIGEVLAARHIVPLVDFAYQGLGTGLEDDSAGLLALCDACRELAVCTSFSKNFGLYNERVGALTVVADSADHAKVVLSHLKTCARTNYSNPPSHGSSVVQGVLGSSELTALWKKELAVMCDRINSMRKLFVDTLAAKRVTRDFSFLTRQRGMFSFSGLNRDQVQKLRDDHSIYIVGSGRINVAGMTEDNMDTLCSAIATVM